MPIRLTRSEHVVCDASDPVGRVAQRLRARGAGFAVILEQGAPVGIVTARQIAVRRHAGLGPRAPVRGIMTFRARVPRATGLAG